MAGEKYHNSKTGNDKHFVLCSPGLCIKGSWRKNSQLTRYMAWQVKHFICEASYLYFYLIWIKGYCNPRHISQKILTLYSHNDLHGSPDDTPVIHRWNCASAELYHECILQLSGCWIAEYVICFLVISICTSHLLQHWTNITNLHFYFHSSWSK